MKPAVFGLLLAPFVALAQTGATVEGRVVNKMTGAGIAKVRVDLRTNRGPDEIYFTVTDSSGAFSLVHVKEGAYQPTFSEPGDRFYPTLSGNPSGLISIPSGGSVRLDAEMQPSGTLPVRVVDGEGKPVSGADVFVGVEKFPLTLLTGEDGLATRDLKAGFHWVSVGPSEDLPLPHGLAWQYPKPEYVLVRGGTETLVEMRLGTTPLSANHVSGVVVDESGKPVQGATVRLVAPSEEMPGIFTEDCSLKGCFTLGGAASLTWPQAKDTVKTGSTGAFQLSSVPSGNWRLQGEIESANGTLLRGSTSLAISGDVDGLEIRLARPFSTKAVIEWQGVSEVNELFRGGRASIFSLDTLTSPGDGGVWDVTHSDQLDGLFPGRYLARLSPSGARDFYPAGILLGSREVSGSEFLLSAGSPPIRILYRAGAASMRVVIERPQEAMLVLYPQMPDYTHIVRAATCGPDGTCEMRGIPPGDYYAFLFRTTNDAGLLNAGRAAPKFLQAVISKATSVHLAERAVMAVNLPLIDWPE